MIWFFPSAIPTTPRRYVLARGCCFLLLFSLWPSPAAFAQRRKPVLRPPRHDYFAGKVVLVPVDNRPASLLLPRLVAHVADHEVLIPPRNLFSEPDQAIDVDRVIAWAKRLDYTDVDSVVVSINLLTRGGPTLATPTTSNQATAGPRLDWIREIRAQRPTIPVYGFATLNPLRAGDPTFYQRAIGLITTGVFDHLIVDAERSSTAEREQFIAEIATGKLADRFSVYTGAGAAATVLVARSLNHRFGLTPKVLPLYSSQGGAGAETHPLRQLVSAQIRAVGGVEISAAANAARQADVLLFIHAPQTAEPALASFADEVARAQAAGYRVAFADLSEAAAEKDRMMAELRRHKLLDPLWAYAASAPAGQALGAALAQLSARLVTARFLRDDPDRLQRAERAQIEMLFTRYLEDWAYPVLLRPKLDAFIRDRLQASPDNLGAGVERAEEFARAELNRIAEELFSEQFKGNLHDILLSSGEHVQFVVRSLQRLQFHFPSGRASEPEIRQSLYLALSATMPPQQEGRAAWEFTNPKDLDDRLLARLEAINWPSFDAGTEVVELGLSIGRSGSESAEDYSIRSRKRSKEVRRIEVTASSVRGAFYALGRLEQLGADGKLREDLQLTEMPSFKQRGLVDDFGDAFWSQRDRLDVLRFMGRVRMNRYYYAPEDDPLRRERWREPFTGGQADRFKELMRVARENFVDLVYEVSPGPHLTYSSDEDLAALTRKFDSLAALGVHHFALFFDDTPETWQPARDKGRSAHLAAAQAYLISRAYDHLQRTLPGSSLAVRPALDTSLAGARDYLKELGAALPKEIQVFWTGSGVSSPEYTDAEAREWGELIGRRPIVWDSFPGNGDRRFSPGFMGGEVAAWRLHLGPQRGASPTLNEQVIGLIAHPMTQAHASMLPLATAADYAWDARGYNPDQSLGRALNLLFDERSRAGMRVWSEVYRDYPGDNNVFKPLFWPQRGEVNLQLLERNLVALGSALEAIGATREHGLARGELATFLGDTRAAIERLKNDPAYERLADGNYRLRPDWNTLQAVRDDLGTQQRADGAGQADLSRGQWRALGAEGSKFSVSWDRDAVRVRVRIAGGASRAESVRLLLDTDLAGGFTALRSNEDDYSITVPLKESLTAVRVSPAAPFRRAAPPRQIDPATIQVRRQAGGHAPQEDELEVQLPPGIFGRPSFEAGFKFGLAVVLLQAGPAGTEAVASSARVDPRNPATWSVVELK